MNAITVARTNWMCLFFLTLVTQKTYSQEDLIFADTLILCNQDSAVVQLMDSSFNMVVWEQEGHTGRVLNDEMTVRNTGLYRVFAADSTQGDTVICFTTTDQQAYTYLEIPENYIITEVLTGYYGTPSVDCQNPEPGWCHVDVTDIIQSGLVGKRSSDYFQGAHPDMCIGVVKTLFVKLRCMKYTEDSVYVKQMSVPENFQTLSDTMICPEETVNFSLPTLTCDTTFIPVDTLLLSITSNNDVNSIPTKVGLPYKITVRNAVSYGSGAGNQVDGAYRSITAAPTEYISWRLDGMQYGSLPDFRPIPNEYNPEHEYEFFILGNGLSTVFRANDSGSLGDNSGQFQFIMSEMHINNHCELNYLWSNGTVGPNVLLHPSETPAVVFLSDGLDHCPIDTVNVASIESSLAIDGGPYIAICAGDSVVLSASGSSDNYTWSNGVQNGQAFVPDTSAFYYVEGIVDACLESDSVFVDILMPVESIDSLITCDSLTWIDGVTYTESTNSPTFVLQNAAGCDSTITLDLSVNYTTYNTIDTTAIDSFEYNGEVYTEDGEYVVYLENQAGCDSVVTLKLDFEYVGVNDFVIDKGWVVYPNPAENRITIAFDSDEDAGHVTVHNQLGQEVWTDFVSRTYTLDVSDWPRGFYVFHYSGDRLRHRLSVVLE